MLPRMRADGVSSRRRFDRHGTREVGTHHPRPSLCVYMFLRQKFKLDGIIKCLCTVGNRIIPGAENCTSLRIVFIVYPLTYTQIHIRVFIQVYVYTYMYVHIYICMYYS